ncbi:MAG: glycine--tRNA ligase subunit beta [bacterium]
MATFLLEIGTEEIPGREVPLALQQISALATEFLRAERIEFTSIQTWGTARRLTLIVSDIADLQTDTKRELQGPSVADAFTPDGDSTAVAIGFARNHHRSIAELDIIEFNGIEHLTAVYHEKGLSSIERLPEICVKIIKGINLPSKMRWRKDDIIFSRPIRWVTAIYDDNVVNFTIGGIKSGRFSRGHRYLSPGEIEINNANNYRQIMEENHVIVSQDERRNVLRNQLDGLISHDGAVIADDGKLFNDLLYHVEYPTAFRGSFHPDFLSLPEEVLRHVLRREQKLFPLTDSTGKLLPSFIAVRNGDKAYLSNVREGFESVTHAKLMDARFFFEKDQKKTPEERVDNLRGVTSSEGIGSMYDKAKRLQMLAGKIAAMLGMQNGERANAERAALLAKTDQVTSIIAEYPRLRGAIGRAYAWMAGESPAVATAIGEQYAPEKDKSTLPSSLIGKIIALADRIDRIVTTNASVGDNFINDEMMNADMLAVARLMTEGGLNCNLPELLFASLEPVQNLLTKPAEDIVAEIHIQIIQQVNVALEIAGFSPTIAAAAAIQDIYPNRNMSRAKVLQTIIDNEDGKIMINTGRKIQEIANGIEGLNIVLEDLPDADELKSLANEAENAVNNNDIGALATLLMNTTETTNMIIIEYRSNQNEVNKRRIKNLAVIYASLADMSKISRN